MLGRDEQIQQGFADFQNFAQGFGFDSRETIFYFREFQKTHKVGFHQGCDTGVAWRTNHIWKA